MKKKIVYFLFTALCCFFHCNASALQDGSSSNEQAEEESKVFVILTHIKTPFHETLYKRCYQSVRQFYPDTLIVIIDDNSTTPVSGEGLTNTIVVRSEYPGAGELLPYYYFVNCKWADKMIFLHDSMFLKRAFTEEEMKAPLKFHWNFYDRGRPDHPLRMDFFLSHLPYGPELIEFNHQNNWRGCFGVTSIIHLKALEQIENKYSFTHILKDLIHNRTQREAVERIFAILAFKENLVQIENCSNFGSIHNYPHNFRNVNEDLMNQIITTYPGAILKTWQGR